MLPSCGMQRSFQGRSLPRAWLFLLLVLHTFHFQSQLTVSSAVFPEKELISKEKLLTTGFNRFLAFQRVQQCAVKAAEFSFKSLFLFSAQSTFFIYAVQLWMSTDMEHYIPSQVWKNSCMSYECVIFTWAYWYIPYVIDLWNEYWL